MGVRACGRVCESVGVCLYDGEGLCVDMAVSFCARTCLVLLNGWLEE